MRPENRSRLKGGVCILNLKRNARFVKNKLQTRLCFLVYLAKKKRNIMYINIIKRPARDACLCMGELLAPPAPPAPAAPPAPPAPHFVFLITL